MTARRRRIFALGRGLESHGPGAGLRRRRSVERDGAALERLLMWKTRRGDGNLACAALGLSGFCCPQKDGAFRVLPRAQVGVNYRIYCYGDAPPQNGPAPSSPTPSA